VNAWHTISQAYGEESVALPVTAVLTALHNMVTETIEPTYFGEGRKKFFCPADVLAGLQTGLFAADSQVQAFKLPAYDTVEGVPGLATSHGSINC